MKSRIRLYIDKFEVESQLSKVHYCGGWDKSFEVELSIECEELDDNGYVVNNDLLVQSIRNYFKRAKFRASCEQICECIVDLCAQLLGERLCKVIVKVYNKTGHLAIDWNKGAELPPLPVEIKTVHEDVCPRGCLRVDEECECEIS